MSSMDMGFLTMMFKSTMTRYPQNFTEDDLEAFRYTFKNRGMYCKRYLKYPDEYVSECMYTCTVFNSTHMAFLYNLFRIFDRITCVIMHDSFL